jgi:hypothetical protein
LKYLRILFEIIGILIAAAATFTAGLMITSIAAFDFKAGMASFIATVLLGLIAKFFLEQSAK